jgi:serine/threonine-protein kinase
LNLTQPGQPAGSYHYMSPEQVRGGQSLDARVDIYGCGAVLYELVTGRRVFPGDSAFDLMQAHCERVPETPRSLNPDVPRELEEVILKALAKNPEDRFQSADSFAKALAKVPLGVAPVVAATPSPRPNARAYAVGLSLALAVAGAAAFYPVFHTTASAAAPKADRIAVTAPASLPATPQVVPPVVVPVPAPKPVPPSRPKTTNVARVQASPVVVAEPEPSTTELTEIEAPPVLETPSDPPPAPQTVDPKTPNKVTRAIKRLNPFRKK